MSEPKLPCVCCGRSLLAGGPARDPSDAAASTTHWGPLFVCAVCYASAFSIATELEGAPADDDITRDMPAPGASVSVQRHREVLRDTLYGMARLGWLGQHAKLEP
jgi:hypothetical protein